MKKLFVVFVLMTLAAFSSAQQKYALVIGNGNYTNFGKLPNAVNDANDMTTALQGLGFTVDKVIDGDRTQMEGAINRLKNRLSVSKNSYGFLFYAGHGLQFNGINYLIPAKAEIPGANYLGDRAVSVQTMLAELNDAGNELNIVVLDACRDFPAAWMRSTNRGLTVVANQPADSIIVYATSAGSTAADGTGRNGLFTSQLLKNLKTPGLEVSEVFRLTGADVSQVSSRQQIPAIYNQFFGRAYLGARPSPASVTPAAPSTVQGANSIGLSINEWKVNKDSSSTVNVKIGRENIDGQERDVLTLEINLARGDQKWACAQNYNDTIAQKLRGASGVRFKALGDGKKWAFIVPMRETSGDGGSHRIDITTRKGRVVAIDVPFSKLKQPDWGKKVTFNKNSIIGMQIERNNNLGAGAATIKIFDIEVY